MAFETIYYQEFNKTTDQLQADGILAPGGWLRFNNQKIASGNYVITLVYKKDFAVNRGYLLIDSRFTPSDAIETIPAESCFFNLWDYKNYDFYIASGTNKWYGFNDSPDDPNDEVIIKIEIDLYRKTSSVHRNGLFMYSERLRYDEYGNIPFEDFIFSFWAEESPNYPNAVGGLIKSLKIENERTFETLFYMEVEKSNQAYLEGASSDEDIGPGVIIGAEKTTRPSYNIFEFNNGGTVSGFYRITRKYRRSNSFSFDEFFYDKIRDYPFYTLGNYVDVTGDDLSILFAYINTNDIDKPISNFSEIRSDGSFSTEDTSQEGQIRELIYEFDFDNRVFSIRRDGINLFSGYIAPDANKFLEKFRFDLQYRVGVEYYTHYIKIEKKIKAIELAFWKNLRNCTET